MGSTITLFILSTATHIAMSLSPAILALYKFTAVIISSLLAVLVVSQPQFTFAPVLENAPILIALLIWEIDYFSHLYLEPLSLPLWSTENMAIEAYPQDNPFMMHESKSDVADSTYTDCAINDDKSTISSIPGSRASSQAVTCDRLNMLAPDNSLFKHMQGHNQSYAPSSRPSDISLSSGFPNSLPSSWGSSTRGFFQEYQAPSRNIRHEGHTGSQTEEAG
ncbi:hypothetical protein F4777DRAFT_58271 [Nemania sp. FL0916]|nr:hypothetical protein F4777DRAFT_58271 [Nemania sp. FL0916]